VATADISKRFDAVIVGGGHNGLVCAAYLAKAGQRVVVIEARSEVGGTASSEVFSGVTVNICNCDHLTFRTTGVSEDLDLARHGLKYLDVDPTQLATSWSDRRIWPHFRDIDKTLNVIKYFFKDEVDGYRAYLRDAMPIAEMIIEAASQPPTRRSLIGKVISRRGRGVTTMLRWSKLSSAQVLRKYFKSELLIGPALVTGPTVCFTTHTRHRSWCTHLCDATCFESRSTNWWQRHGADFIAAQHRVKFGCCNDQHKSCPNSLRGISRTRRRTQRRH
jgi:phytoene dehydrogenase-like protein